MDYKVTYNAFGRRGTQFFGERRSAINLAKTLPSWRDAVVYGKAGDGERKWKKIWSYSV